jgi:flagellar biosynthesis protein FlhB
MATHSSEGDGGFQLLLFSLLCVTVTKVIIHRLRGLMKYIIEQNKSALNWKDSVDVFFFSMAEIVRTVTPILPNTGCPA